MTVQIDLRGPVRPSSPKAIDRFINSLTLIGDNGCASRRSALPVNLSTSEKLQFLQASAHALQRKFEKSEFSFFDVTVVSAGIQTLVREISNEVRQAPLSFDQPTVLVTSPRSEQHTLMQGLLDLHFRLSGWESIHHPHIRSETLAAMLASRSIDLVCISWSNSRIMEEFRDIVAIIAATNASKRPPVIAGGFAAEKAAGQIAQWGVDCICDDVYAALDIAERYISLRRSAMATKSAKAAIKDALSICNLR